jgi:hypothetical protein
MLKKILFIGALIIGIISIVMPGYDVANALGKFCFTCASICTETLAKGMGNCDKEDVCCQLDLEVVVLEADIDACNWGGACTKFGISFDRSELGLRSSDWINAANLVGRGQSFSEVVFLDGSIWDSLFCAEPLLQGCYWEERDAEGNVIARELQPTCPATSEAEKDCECTKIGDKVYKPYYFCPATACYDYTRVTLQTDNWTPAEPSLDQDWFPLGSTQNQGSIHVKEMIVYYKKFKGGILDADGNCQYASECPAESEIVHYVLNEDTGVYEEKEGTVVEPIPCPETNCSDGIDNDRDGDVDCSDSDCTEPCPAEVCDDGIDNDQNGLVDCDDPICSESCNTPETRCFDGIDNDGDGQIDCADSDCTPGQLGKEMICCDGKDNDCDGNIDKDDIDCKEKKEVTCNDLLDNDLDGDVDCADSDCFFECFGPEINCRDRIDNDGDGQIDCADSDCKVGSEANCGDGIDNDCDGLVDCDDPDCCNACGAPETACDDGIDNDCDGQIDCPDSDCASVPPCCGLDVGEACTADDDCCTNRCFKGFCK